MNAGPCVMWSIWEQRHFHDRADLVVIGGGLVGLFTALFHQRHHPAHRVLVLERGPFPAGASVRNAGFACFGSPSELLADMDREGRDKALARVEERWKGLHELRSELGDDPIGYECSGGHEVFRSDDGQYTRVAERFDQLNDDLRPLVGDTAFHWDDKAIDRMGLGGVQHLVRTTFEGALDSGALMRSLLARTNAAGVLFRGTAEVSRLTANDRGVEIELSSGEVLWGEQVLVATNGYAGELLPELGIRPARGQVLLTAPIPGLKLKGTFHHDEGYNYFRDLRGAVLLGGGRNLDPEGESTTVAGTTTPIMDHLEQLLREVVLPGIPFVVQRRWSGIMGFPQLGKDPVVARSMPRVAVAAGLSGMGVAIGIRVARRAATLLH